MFAKEGILRAGYCQEKYICAEECDNYQCHEQILHLPSSITA
jgi:hypothetical protein